MGNLLFAIQEPSVSGQQQNFRLIAIAEPLQASQRANSSSQMVVDIPKVATQSAVSQVSKQKSTGGTSQFTLSSGISIESQGKGEESKGSGVDSDINYPVSEPRKQNVLNENTHLAHNANTTITAGGRLISQNQPPVIGNHPPFKRIF